MSEDSYFINVSTVCHLIFSLIKAATKKNKISRKPYFFSLSGSFLPYIILNEIYFFLFRSDLTASDKYLKPFLFFLYIFTIVSSATKNVNFSYVTYQRGNAIWSYRQVHAWVRKLTAVKLQLWNLFQFLLFYVGIF